MTPSEEEALELHRKYGSSEIVVRHCRKVAEAAKALADSFEGLGRKLDEHTVVAGALLHDIGRSRTQAVNHGLVGAELLEKEGVDGRVAQIVRCHVGAGLSPEEAKRVGLPDMDFVPRTLEERIVCFADKMVDLDGVRPFEVEVRRFARKGHDVERLHALKRGLQDELGQDPERLVLDNVKESQ